MNLQSVWTNTHTDRYKHVKTHLFIFCDEPICLLTASDFSFMHMSPMQTGNWKQIRRVYYTWLHCLNNSYINSELDLCQRDCQCDTKSCFFSGRLCCILFTWIQSHPHTLEVSHDTCMVVVLFLFLTGKLFLSCSCRSTDTQPTSNHLNFKDIPTTYTAWVSIWLHLSIITLMQPVTFQWKSTDLVLDG